MFWETNILLKKDTEKVVLIQVKGLISIVIKLSSDRPVVFRYNKLHTKLS